MNIFSDPQKIIDSIDIFSGQHVADLGAGSGAYTLAIAEKMRREGSTGEKVFAVDIQKDLLERITAEAESRKVSSVHVIWGNLEQERGTRLRHDSIDLVIIANTLFQVSHRSEALKEAYRILKKGGRIVIIDWSESFGNIGPKSDHVISQRTAELLAEEAGFTKEQDINAGEHHYGFISKKI